MNKKEFELLSKDRIIHSALALGDGKLEPPYGARTFGLPTICRFYDSSLQITDYYTNELLLEMPYDTLYNAEFSVCSRLAEAAMIPYYLFFGQLVLLRKDSRRFVIEFKLIEALISIRNLLKLHNVKIVDEIGIIDATNNYDQEKIYEFIESNIDRWAIEYNIKHPQFNDIIV